MIQNNTFCWETLIGTKPVRKFGRINRLKCIPLYLWVNLSSYLTISLRWGIFQGKYEDWPKLLDLNCSCKKSQNLGRNDKYFKFQTFHGKFSREWFDVFRKCLYQLTYFKPFDLWYVICYKLDRLCFRKRVY